MLECLWSLDPGPDLRLVDAVGLPGAPVTASAGAGDCLSYAIACASIWPRWSAID